MNDVQHYADAMVAAIDEDIAVGPIPTDMASFTELHDYVDAHGYIEDGGAVGLR